MVKIELVPTDPTLRASMVAHEFSFSINVVHEDGSLVLALAGERDIATGPVLREAVGELISRHLRAVTLDMAALDFVDLTGLQVFLSVPRAGRTGAGRVPVAVGQQIPGQGDLGRRFR